MDQPAYFPISSENVPVARSEDNKAELKVFSGSILNQTGPIPTHTPINAATLEIDGGGKISIPIPRDHNALIYLLDGKIKVAGFGQVDGLHAVIFENDGEGIVLEGIDATRILFLTGIPLNEKVVSQGPFVMNSQTEILEAMRDYQMGKMGILIEE
jgi:redox-sensitive bicupin YhaK (pirin superfamily)